jgi:GTP-binding protein LepA
VDILVNGEKVDALSQIVHRDNARPRALQACERLKEEIPRRLFPSPHPGAIGGEIIARTTISLSQDVTAKCYGGYYAQAETPGEAEKGKKRMKMIGSVSIPRAPFFY